MTTTTTTNPTRLSPTDVETLTGATYRQLGYWARMGYLRVPSPGIGRPREWPAEELRVARVMARLTAASLLPAMAERVARGEAEIAPGIRVEVLDEVYPCGICGQHRADVVHGECLPCAAADEAAVKRLWDR